MVCANANIDLEKRLTFDLLSNTEARSYCRMFPEDNCVRYESICQMPECLHNDQTMYGDLLMMRQLFVRFVNETDFSAVVL